MLFTLIYLTLQFFSVKTVKNFYIFTIGIFLIISLFACIITRPINVSAPINAYNYTPNIVSDDFFIFFYFFFINLPASVYLLAFMLTLFSIFFILFYFSYKTINFNKNKKKKIIFLLRKQNLIHQSSLKPTYTTFQKK